MAQTLTLSDQAVRIVITTTNNTPVLAYSDASLLKIVNAVDDLHKIRPLSRVEFSVPGGGFTNLITFYPTDLANAMLFRFSNSVPATESYKIEFSSGEWTQEAITQAKKVKEAFLALNSTVTLTSSQASVATGSFVGFPSHPTLSSGLVAYWKHEESGVGASRIDSIGTHTLLVTESTPGDLNGGAGFHNGASYSNSGSQLSVNTTDFQLVVPITVSSWIRVNTAPTPGQAHIFMRGLQIAGVTSWQVYYDTTLGTVIGKLFNGGVAATAGIAISTATWYHMLVKIDPAAKTISVSINNGAFDTSGVLGTPVLTVDDQLIVDWSANGNIGMDETAIWNRALTTQEHTDRYNGGTGLFP